MLIINFKLDFIGPLLLIYTHGIYDIFVDNVDKIMSPCLYLSNSYFGFLKIIHNFFFPTIKINE
jgi:hypothetical protein